MAKPKRLRKQPRLHRVEAVGVGAIPKVIVPPAAKKRKRRNRQRYKVPTEVFKKVVFSARWMSLGLVVVTLLVLFFVGTDDVFYLKTMPVTGNKTITDAEIITSSGLSGSHIFSANPSRAAERIGDVPGVISATVTLQWPNKVNIKVEEDTPVALWVQNGQDYWINNSGKLIPARGNFPELLQIELEGYAPFLAGQSIPEDILSGAMLLRELRPNIDHLFYQSGNGLSYQDGRGWRVYFGTGQDMAQKLVVYETIVEDLTSRSITPAYINVRKGLKPYYSLYSS